jgi:uncharacterized protein with von Willebrand factor type A (vWA) domain
MFEGFPSVCRSHHIQADVRSLLLLQKAFEKGLVNTLGDVYQFFKVVIVKDPKHLGPYSKAFYEYFVSIDVNPGERLSDGVLRSEVFKDWLDDFLNGDEDRLRLSDDELVDQFLSEVHTTTYDIQKVLDGQEILDKDDPHRQDTESNVNDDDNARRLLDKAADYRFVDLEELRRRMEKVLEQQKFKHEGGSHWIGTGGTSPYGHGGAAMGGIRVKGSGGGKMAREVIDGAKYYPVDVNTNISDDNIDAALASLKGVIESSSQRYLDVPQTIQTGLKQGGLFLPIELDKTEERLQVILLIDNGGYSMDYYIRSVQTLFKKMKTRYQHDLETYYFHNTIYKYVYEDDHRTRAVPLERILAKDPNYRIFVIGDAAMAPYELHEGSIIAWGRLQEKFKKMAWLNPVGEKYWHITWTTMMLKRIMPMYPMTPHGLENAVLAMNKIQNKSI